MATKGIASKHEVWLSSGRGSPSLLTLDALKREPPSAYTVYESNTHGLHRLCFEKVSSYKQLQVCLTLGLYSSTITPMLGASSAQKWKKEKAVRFKDDTVCL